MAGSKGLRWDGMHKFVLTVSAVWGRSSSAVPGSERSSGGGARGGGGGCGQAAVVDEAEAAASAEARRLPDLRGAPAVLAEVAALVVAVLAEVAALVEAAAGTVARRLPDLRGVAALAEVADGTVTPFARPRWDEFIRQFFVDQLVPDLRGIFLSRD
uniref:Uncharacterized protein n=1 Tax=Oryza rufipogon TaxID=4529 RepID=A0A0E0MYX4_ORYRU